MMHCPTNTVKRRMLDARRRLRVLLPALDGSATSEGSTLIATPQTMRSITKGLAAPTRLIAIPPGMESIPRQRLQRQESLRSAQFKAAGNQRLHPRAAPTGTNLAARPPTGRITGSWGEH